MTIPAARSRGQGKKDSSLLSQVSSQRPVRGSSIKSVAGAAAEGQLPKAPESAPVLAAKKAKEIVKAKLKEKEQQIQDELVNRKQAVEERINREFDQADEDIVWSVSDLPSNPSSQPKIRKALDAQASPSLQWMSPVLEEDFQEAVDAISSSSEEGLDIVDSFEAGGPDEIDDPIESKVCAPHTTCYPPG